jgi:hypothetical protein
MAKKRKKVRKITVDYTAIEKDLEKPLCFGQKCSFCISDICGRDWYDSCEGGK